MHQSAIDQIRQIGELQRADGELLTGVVLMAIAGCAETVLGAITLYCFLHPWTPPAHAESCCSAPSRVIERSTHPHDCRGGPAPRESRDSHSPSAAQSRQ